MQNELAERFQYIRTELAAAATAAGRKPEEIKLVAVSKTFPVSTVQQAYELGERVFGENRVQELQEKHQALPEDVEWHFIGHLQSNKVKPVVACADYIHSIDSVKLLQRVNRLAAEQQRCPKVLLEINISGEPSKFGETADGAALMAEAAINCDNLDFCGLMTMAPFGADDNELQQVFGGLRQLRDKLAADFNITLPELSMGMSGDFKIAVANGATMVRIGSAIFGRRCAL